MRSDERVPANLVLQVSEFMTVFVSSGAISISQHNLELSTVPCTLNLAGHECENWHRVFGGNEKYCPLQVQAASIPGRCWCRQAALSCPFWHSKLACSTTEPWSTAQFFPLLMRSCAVQAWASMLLECSQCESSLFSSVHQSSKAAFLIVCMRNAE